MRASRPAVLRRSRRLLGVVAAPTALAVAAATLSVSPSEAAPPVGSTSASDVVIGLLGLGNALGAAAQQPALADDFPLTDLSVRDVLQLDTALGRRVTAAVLNKNATLDTIDDVISADPALEMRAVTPLASAPADSIEWLLDIDLTGTAPVALTYADDRMQFGAAELAGEATGRLTGQVRLRFDDSAEDLREFSVVGQSELTTHVWTRPAGSSAGAGQDLPIAPFTVRDGFVELAAEGAGRIDTTTVLRLRDPNGRGALTTEDLQLSDPAEMFATRRLPGADDVSMDVSLTSDLLDGGPHGAVTVGTRAADAETPYATPVIARETALEQLTALTRTQALTGFTQYATALRSAEGAADAELPLLDANLSDLYSPADDLIDLLSQQATATITCGAADTNPPSGAPRPGQVQYCQATTTGVSVDDGATVTWASPDPTVRITGVTAATVGTAPTDNVEVTGGGGFPVLTTSFASNGEKRTARTVTGSIQELGRAIGDLGLDGTVTYAPDTRALEVAVRQDDAASRSADVLTGGSGSLAPLTGLTGLCQAVVADGVRSCPQTGDAPGAVEPPAGDATVATAGRYLEATFGLGLVDPAPLEEGDQPTLAEADQTPVAYLKPGPDGRLWEIGSVDAGLDGDTAMAARIGFLKVDVDVTDYDLTQAAGQPAARVTVPTGTVALQYGEVAGALPVADLLDDGQSTVVAEPEGSVALSATASLDVADAPTIAAGGGAGERLVGADGTIDATWATLAAGALPTVTTGGAYDDLRLLDLVPSRNGTMGEASDGATLVDESADFYAQFGVADDTAAEDRVVNRQLYDLAPTDPTASICTQFTVDSATTVTCTDGPLAEVGFTAGHPYVINGDPEALRDKLIDDYAAVLLSFASPSPELGADKTLPLLDVVPSELNRARQGLNAVLLGLQGSATGTAAPADTQDVSTLQAFAAAIPAIAPGTEATFGLDGDRLSFATTRSESDQSDSVPLRLAAGESQLRIVTDAVDDDGVRKPAQVLLGSESSATVDLTVDLATAASYVGSDTRTVETVTDVASADIAALGGKDAEYGSAALTVGATGSDLRIGVTVTTDSGSTEALVPLADFRDSLTQDRALAGAAQQCPGNTGGADVAACATVPLDGSDTVRLDLKATDSSGGTGADLAGQPLATQFLVDALSGFDRTLGDSLDGELAGVTMPLVGADLDAAADVPAAVRAFSGAARQALDVQSVTGIATTADAGTLETAVENALNGIADTPETTLAPVDVTLRCTSSCTSSSKVADVTSISAPLALSGTVTEQPVAFDAGLPGVSIDTVAEVVTTVDWDLSVTVGIQKGTGPYLQLPDTSTPLTATVEARLPDRTDDSCHAWTRASYWEDAAGAGSVPAPTAARCIDAVVGTMPSVLVDLGDTGLQADVAVEIDAADANGNDGRVYLPSIYDRELGFNTSATGTGGLDVYAESFAGELGFFDTVGAISLTWEDEVFSDLSFDNTYLDATTFYKAVGEGFGKARQWLAPLNPVVETLSAPIPVINDLATLVGAGPVSMLSILVKRYPNLGLITNLIAFQQLVGNLPELKDEPELVSLSSIDEGGSFEMDADSLKVGSCSSTAVEKLDDGTTKTEKSSKSNVGAESACDVEDEDDKKGEEGAEVPAEEEQEKPKTVTEVSSEAYFDLPSISVPVLQDSEQVYNLLLGEGDATLLYVDLGHLGFNVGVSRSFGPFMVGPVPVSASIGGEIGIDGRMAFGFDTRGLTQKIEAIDPGATDQLTGGGSVFKDGFYIDDLEEGDDVPEIELTFTVEAGAAVSIGFAEAGIKGGVVLDLGLDAFDPDGSGKIYTDEFIGASAGPSCAFNVSSGIVFFLQFYFSIDLFLFSIEEEFDIVRSPRLTLFEFNCATEEPVLAKREGDDLRLLMGESYAGERKVYTGQQNEKFTVRQLSPTRVEVTAFNIVQEYDVPATGRILADAGSGNDIVRLYPGQLLSTEGGSTKVTTVPVTTKAVVDAGAGNDAVVTGGGADTVTGGSGNDTVDAGDGEDTVSDASGNDILDGGAGRDSVDGGAGDDRTSGGPSTDEVKGGDGNDVVEGGLGMDVDSLFPTDDDAAIAALVDSGDVLVGGNGSDTVNGGDGSDLTVGGAFDTAGISRDQRVTITVSSASGTQIIDNDVSVLTVALPSEASVLASCQEQGAASDGGVDSVTGGDARDYVLGGAGADTLSGGGDDDIVCGRGGDDLLDGDGSDVLVDDQGDDVVRGGDGRDRIYGSGGTDTLSGDAGDDLARGGEGDDTLAGGTGSDLLVGDAGDDVVKGEPADPSAPLGAGRSIVCRPSTSIVVGLVDLNGDLSGTAEDDGQLEGLQVTDGYVLAAGGGRYSGVLAGVVFSDGRADLDGNGRVEGRPASGAVLGDTGTVELAGLTGATGDGDCVLGGEGTDELDGGAGGDFVDAGEGDETKIRGGVGDDFVRGGDGADLLHGDAGNDLVSGDADGDILYGDAGNDVVRGSSGTDLLAGGSDTAGVADGADEVLGDGSVDVVAGGNAALAFKPGTTGSIVEGVDATLLATPASGDNDKLYGGYASDWVFGQAGDDQVFGGPDDDNVEGGNGADLVQGDDGADLLVGGSSTSGPLTLNRSGAGQADGADTLVGDEGVDEIDGQDILAGDNAKLVPPSQNTAAARTWWARIRPTVGITLYDTATTQAPAAAVSGSDTLYGNGQDDLLLGQGGNDTVYGGDGVDAVEGAAGADTLFGEAGDDHLIGGSWVAGSYDGVSTDTVDGGDGNDLVLGDNGTVTGAGTTADPAKVTLLNQPATGGTAPVSTYGPDRLGGGVDDDLVFGQGGDDELRGGDGYDGLEGDAGSDRLFGEAGDDALTGGSSSADGVIGATRTGTGQLDGADALDGGTGDDVLAGDNARLVRQDGLRADGTTRRDIALFDLDRATARAAAGTGGADTLVGGDGRDLAFGQGGKDRVDTGTGDDYAEGGADDDTLLGGTGQDDLLGGGSSNTGVVISGNGTDDRLLSVVRATSDSSATGLVDGNDSIDGGADTDVVLGDNGRITRGGPNQLLAGGPSGPRVVRQVAMADSGPGIWAGSDTLIGGQGDDDLYGQFDATGTSRPQSSYAGQAVSGDVLDGGDGDDALLGDQGVDVPTAAATLGRTNEVIRNQTGFLTETVRPNDSLVRVVTQTEPTVGGADLLLGGTGLDSLHAGAGDDLVNSGDGDDVTFAGDGNDVVWGGADHDRIFGGAGDDLLDTKKWIGVPALWMAVAPSVDTDGRRITVNGSDLIYGGQGHDALQADQNDQGRVAGDRLVDWTASYNRYLVCSGSGTANQVVDVAESTMVTALTRLAEATGSVGAAELSLVASGGERLPAFSGTAGTNACEGS
ncbi:calcium-binding protein [Nocardioides kribbensis]|uniref:calcium-binding protein n=1 Tax=Nocardioides kribbensis TaxID=305517 RepID=UPI0031D2CD4A